MRITAKLAVLTGLSIMLAVPSWAYSVHVIGRGTGSEQLADIQPTMVKNVVEKMAAHGVVSVDIKTITIDAEIEGSTFEGAEIWVKTKNGDSYLLDANFAGDVTSVDKRK